MEDVATPQAFARNPDMVQRFYNARRAQLQTAKPGAAHQALAKLQQNFSGTVTLITQNVDTLLTQAGARDVIHMHGRLDRVFCVHCGVGGEIGFEWQDDCDQQTACPDCGAVPALRPDIVWFGEMPYQLDRISAALDDCDLFVSIGTSGHVYPAAGFVQQVAANSRAERVELNLEKSMGSAYFTENRFGPAGTLVPQWVEEILL